MRILESIGIDPMKWFLGDEDVAERLLKMTIMVCQSQDSKNIAKAFYEILGPVQKKLPFPFPLLFKTGKISEKLLAKELALGMKMFAGRFIAGDGILSIARTIQRYRALGFHFNIDIVGDTTLSEKEADEYVGGYERLYRVLPNFIPNDDMSSSIKISACFSQIRQCAPEYAADMICERLRPVLDIAKQYGWKDVYFDALEKDYREIQMLVFKKMYREYGSMVKFVLQSYFPDSINTLDALARIKVEYGAELWVRLVLGAYWGFEQYVAELRNWDAPVYTEKSETDNNFQMLFKNGMTRGLTMIGGTHNPHLMLFALQHGAPELQFIYGMGEEFGKEIVDAGRKARFYMPIVLISKSMNEALGYLLRRVDDNTGHESFIAKNYGQRKKGKMLILQDGLKRLPRGGKIYA